MYVNVHIDENRVIDKEYRFSLNLIRDTSTEIYREPVGESLFTQVLLTPVFIQ